MNRFAILVVGALLGSVLVTSTGIAQKADREARPLLVGVVDISVVFKSCKRKDDLEKLVNAKREKGEAELKALVAEVGALETRLRALDPQTQEWRGLNDELEATRRYVKEAERKHEAGLKSEVEAMTISVIDDIEKAVHDLATERRFDVVFKTESKAMKEERFQERLFRAQVRSIMFSKEELDLTQDVIARLDDRDDARKRAAPR